MYYDKQPEYQQNNYKTMLEIMGKLSRLFSESATPYLYYRAHENIFAKYFDMENNGKRALERYKKFAKYTAARYGAYPVAWTLAGELPGYMGDLQKNAELWNEVAKEAEKWNAYNNLQSAHLACSRPFPKIYENESWFDFAMSQAGHGDFSMDQKMYI